MIPTHSLFFKKPYEEAASSSSVPYNGPVGYQQDANWDDSLQGYDDQDAESKTSSVEMVDVDCDTSDLLEYEGKPPFVLNFSGYGENLKNLNMHIGLRRKMKRNHCNAKILKNLVTTDDYSSEVIRFLKNQPSIQNLEFVIEVHVDDDRVYYKLFDDLLQESKHPQDPSPGSAAAGVQPQPVSNSAGDFNFDLMNYTAVAATADEKSLEHRPYIKVPRAFLNATGVSTHVTTLHVELPGLSSCNLGDWKYFLEFQRCLKTIICNFGSVLWTFYALTILFNENTLEKIVLRRIISFDVKRGKDIPLDFKVFGGCNKLAYLKITGGGYRGVNRWSEWENYGHPPAPGEILLFTNFLAMNTDNLVEFHFSHLSIDHQKLEDLAKICRNKKLRYICRDCPDHEYYDGDYNVFYQETTPQSLKEETDDAALDIELAMLVSGYTTQHEHAHFVRALEVERVEPRPSCKARTLILTLTVAIIFSIIIIVIVIIVER